MLALYIFLGIIGLGLVVIVHEAGHFLAARAVGITVEVFSVGWGKKMFGIVRGDTEYRISWIPLGGFVKMKGETDYIKAVEEGLDQVETTSDSFFGAAPWKRIIVAMAGPAMNIVFALLVFMIINLSGVSQFSYTNRIVLADDYPSLTRFGEGTPSPAALAGLETGDVIVAVEGVETRNFNDIEKWISFRALDRVSLDVLRNGESIELEARLDLDEETGAGILGILEYIEPVVANLSDPESAALEPGDLILAINGREITQRWDVAMALRDIEVQAGQTLARVPGTSRWSGTQSYASADLPPGR
jgi:regulator of sigma E protease